ncbi:MAG TPA: hydantoinase/oxoprolinase family protein [Candidatus Binatia bacterium]|nr:hydantoinase/oxoprolinase family protein [Candidatus Binatia bacterium]
MATTRTSARRPLTRVQDVPRRATGGYRVGIDVGGTFTDLVLVRPDRSIHVDKTATTLHDQSEGVMNGLARLAAHERLALREFLAATERIVHGTTTADNTMIQMNGAVTGLLTSEGHRDEIELRRGYKENIWDPSYPPPPAICPRRRRIGVPERLDFEGNVVTPLDEEAVRAALRRLRLQGVESLAIVFLFSFVNPAHERRAREIAAEEIPGVDVSLSCEVMPQAPEFERTSTTLVNAYVAPKIKRYLRNLETRLREAGYARDLLLMQSNGGLMTASYVADKAVTVLGSGPAGGVVGACHVTRATGARDFISVDMGGTSYDVCLVRGGKPEVTSSWNWHHRYLIGLPMVNVQSVGAGGGSIASVVEGALHVGPQSAGAQPGPICYGRGGTRATVTDANLVLGYLNPDYFYGGELKLDVESVVRAIDEQVRRPLGLATVEEAAYGIFRMVNANMANAIRRVSATRGVDPRELPLVAFGGNGAVHAGMQAAEIGCPEVLVPKTAPTFSALGLLLTDPVVIELRSYIAPADEADLERIAHLYAEMRDSALASLARGGFRGREVRHQRVAYMCYPGQTFDMPVPVAGEDARFSRRDLERAIHDFHSLHEELHTYASRDQMPIVRGVGLSATAITTKPELPRTPSSRRDPRAALKGRRRAYFEGRWVSTPVYDGVKLHARQTVVGPAIVEEPFTTLVVYPGQRATLDPMGNYHLTVRRIV